MCVYIVFRRPRQPVVRAESVLKERRGEPSEAACVGMYRALQDTNGWKGDVSSERIFVDKQSLWCGARSRVSDFPAFCSCKPDAKIGAFKTKPPVFFKRRFLGLTTFTATWRGTRRQMAVGSVFLPRKRRVRKKRVKRKKTMDGDERGLVMRRVVGDGG